MKDREILKWYHLNNAAARKQAGNNAPHYYFVTEGKMVWLVYRKAGEIHLRAVQPEVLTSFRATVMRGYQSPVAVPQIVDFKLGPEANRKKFHVPPTPNTQSERIRFYWQPPSERERQDPWTPEFYLLARGNRQFYLGHRTHYEFYLRQIPKDFYEALKRDIFWRWEQLGIERLVGQPRVEHPDEGLLLDDTIPPASQPRPAPGVTRPLPSISVWEWRKRFGPQNSHRG
jgi:hypothetical protein